jgi:hypothetical protein
MSRFWQKAITVLVIVTVIYVFVSPVFMLDPSANRAWRAALHLLLSIALIASLLFALQKPRMVVDFISAFLEMRGRPEPSLLSSVCLC